MTGIQGAQESCGGHGSRAQARGVKPCFGGILSFQWIHAGVPFGWWQKGYITGAMTYQIGETKHAFLRIHPGSL